MPLPVGTRLGCYEIVAMIGAGGMGEVYRARDSKLGREVALKILTPALANDTEYLMRFQREAQVLASLNHPNIAAVYGLEESAIVMELVEGDTLRGPLPVAEALPVAKQIAEALEAAHEKGIVHRDLKPANIKITPGGTVKVLDFGLAKAAESGPRSSGTISPTLTIGATQAGIILGTAGYMSPEQAAGKPVDKRADIWSFGVVLWELITGSRLFEGETVSHTLADVLRAPIDLTQLPADTPAGIRDVLRRCLDRDIRMRMRDIGEARIAIQRIESDPAAALAPNPSTPVARRPYGWMIAAAALAVTAAAMGFVHFTQKAPPAPLMRLFLNTPPGLLFDSPEISPDGTKVVFVGKAPTGSRLYLRDLASSAITPIPHTDNAVSPFWSPDSRRIAFFSFFQRKLEVADLTTGAVHVLLETPTSGGGTWSPRGFMIFRRQGGLVRLPETGGQEVDVLTSGNQLAREAQFLPDGRHFLYFTTEDGEGGGSIRLGDAQKPGTNRSVIVRSSNGARYLGIPGNPHGHILFTEGKSLLALPFNSTTFSPEGEAFAVGEVLPTLGLGSPTFSVSQTGIIGYLAGTPPEFELSFLDRSGKSSGRIAPATRLTHAAVSPDGTRVLYDIGGSVAEHNLWVFDITRNFRSRITAEGPGVQLQFPIWSADGSTVYYEALRKDKHGLYRRAPNPAAAEEMIVEAGQARITPLQCIGDRFLIYQTRGNTLNSDLWLMPLEGERKAVPLIQTKFNEMQAQVSPDGHWLAYSADDSGEMQIYVSPFAPSSGQVGTQRYQVSLNGGVHPRWSRNGRELYFVSPAPALMAAQPHSTAGWERSNATELFALSGYYPNNIQTPYDVTTDGKFVISPLSAEAKLDFAILLNWRPPERK
jgi:eukaryotic-like serine/threonine-protein kinase